MPFNIKKIFKFPESVLTADTALFDCDEAGLRYIFNNLKHSARPDALAFVVVRYCGPKIVEFLLDAGCDVNYKTPRGHTALMIAVSTMQIDAVELLVKRGALVTQDIIRQALRRGLDLALLESFQSSQTGHSGVDGSILKPSRDDSRSNEEKRQDIPLRLSNVHLKFADILDQGRQRGWHTSYSGPETPAPDNRSSKSKIYRQFTDILDQGGLRGWQTGYSEASDSTRPQSDDTKSRAKIHMGWRLRKSTASGSSDQCEQASTVESNENDGHTNPDASSAVPPPYSDHYEGTNARDTMLPADVTGINEASEAVPPPKGSTSNEGPSMEAADADTSKTADTTSYDTMPSSKDPEGSKAAPHVTETEPPQGDTVINEAPGEDGHTELDSFDAAPLGTATTDTELLLSPGDTDIAQGTHESDKVLQTDVTETKEGSSVEGAHGGLTCIYTESFEMIGDGLPDDLKLHSYVFVDGEWLLNWCCTWVQDFDSNACLEIVNKHIDELTGSVTTLSLRTTPASLALRPPITVAQTRIAELQMDTDNHTATESSVHVYTSLNTNEEYCPVCVSFCLILLGVCLKFFVKFIWTHGVKDLRIQKIKPIKTGLPKTKLYQMYLGDILHAKIAALLVDPLIEQMNAAAMPASELERLITRREDRVIHMAIQSAARGDLETMKRFLEGPDGDVNVSTSQGLTLLMASLLAESYSLSLVKYLLLEAQPTANVHLVTRNRTSPLMIASQRRNVRVVKALLKAGARVSDHRYLDDMNSLMFAADRGNISIVRKMLGGRYSQTGALYVDNVTLNAQNVAGQTALHIAVQNGYGRVVELLCRAGIARDAVDFQGRTARDYAAGNATMVDMIDTLGV